MTSSIGILGLLALLPLLSAFEAHVINVTATIERPPNQCDAKSIGYWRNHEGCFAGTGESDWMDEVNGLSPEFSADFASYTGNQICRQLFIPLCPPGNFVEGQRCRAKAHTLADELNLVSGRLDLNAWIAFADDGSEAFDNLGLVASSTVSEAVGALEGVISDPNSSRDLLEDASHVARRIYEFYEEENPLTPQCIFNDEDLAACQGLLGAAELTAFEAESSSGVDFPPISFSSESSFSPSLEDEEDLAPAIPDEILGPLDLVEEHASSSPVLDEISSSATSTSSEIVPEAQAGEPKPVSEEEVPSETASTTEPAPEESSTTEPPETQTLSEESGPESNEPPPEETTEETPNEEIVDSPE